MKRCRLLQLCICVMLLGVSAIAVAQDAPAEKSEAKILNLNVASLEELKMLPEITPELAQVIIDQRPYRTADEFLEKVKGITEEMLTTLAAQTVAQPLNINAATINELKALPDMPPELAEAIIGGRPYIKVEELLKIRGFGEDRFTKLQGFIDAKPREEGADTEDKGWKTRNRDYLSTESAP